MDKVEEIDLMRSYLQVGTFHDDVIQKVYTMIEFWKKSLKDHENTFLNMQLLGFFFTKI